MRYERTPSLDDSLVSEFWVTCLWIFDYYRYRNFSQKYRINTLLDRFDRNMLLTALMDEEYSCEIFKKAETLYMKDYTMPPKTPSALMVFNTAVLAQLSKYLRLSSTKPDEDGKTCTIITLLKRGQKRSASPTGSERFL